MFSKIKKKLKEKNGLSSIELLVCSLAVVVIFAGLCDFIIISGRMQSISTVMTYMSRTLSVQGCLSNTPEQSYRDTSGKQLYYVNYVKHKNYITSREFHSHVKRMMDLEAIPEDSWRVYIDGKLLTPTVVTPLHDFRDKIEISMEVDYEWRTVSQLLPLNGKIIKGKFNTAQKIVSTYKIREEDSNIGFDYNG